MTGALARLLLPALLFAAGCGGGDGGEQLPPAGQGPAAGAATSPTTLPAVDGAGGRSRLDSDERVLAAYEAYWDVVIKAYATSDWRSGELGRHATGTQLDYLRDDLLDNLTKGRVARGRPRLFGAEVTSRDGDEAEVDDCIDSNRWLFHDVRTGALADRPSGKRYRVTAELRIEDQRWKVADVTYKEERCGA